MAQHRWGECRLAAVQTSELAELHVSVTGVSTAAVDALADSVGGGGPTTVTEWTPELPKRRNNMTFNRDHRIIALG